MVSISHALKTTRVMKLPEQKAQELLDKYRTYIRMADPCGYLLSGDEIYFAKLCAKSAVNDIIESRKDDKNFDDTFFAKSSTYYTPHPMYLTYWLEVKRYLETKQ
jgi:hypothetical protein